MEKNKYAQGENWELLTGCGIFSKLLICRKIQVAEVEKKKYNNDNKNTDKDLSILTVKNSC